MSIEVMAMVFAHDMPALKTDAGKVVSPSTATFVLLALADKASADGENVYPSIKRVVKETKFSEPTVVNAINALRAAGYLVYEGVSRRGTSEYRIDLTRFSGTKLSGGDTKLSKEGTKPSLDEPFLRHTEHVEPVYEDVEQKKSGANVFRLAQAIAEVTHVSFEIRKRQLLAEAKALLKDERVTPALILVTYGAGGPWYKQDWRGLRGQKPGIYDIRATLFTFEPEEAANVISGGLKDRPVREKGGLK